MWNYILKTVFAILLVGTLSLSQDIDWCTVSARIDCYVGKRSDINQMMCEERGCHWCPYPKPSDHNETSIPWCIKENPVCTTNPRTDCYETSMTNATMEECLTKPNCYWCEVFDGGPYCSRNVCASEKLCFLSGERGVTRGFCEGNGHKCKWCESDKRQPRCVENCPTGQTLRYKQKDSCCKITSENRNSLPRVFQGVEAVPGQWPWMGKLRGIKDGQGISCGAVLISRNKALTAAHCVSGLESITSVRFGFTNLLNQFGSNAQSVTNVTEIIHPNYTLDRMQDIAILELNTPITITDFVRPVLLPRSEVVPIGTKCFLTGFGIASYEGLSSFFLLEVETEILQPFRCPFNGFNPELNICAGNIAPKYGKSCKGDSGGPLVCQRCKNCDWYLVGTVLGGAPVCGDPVVGSVFVRTSAYENWIGENGYVPLDTKTYSCT